MVILGKCANKTDDRNAGRGTCPQVALTWWVAETEGRGLSITCENHQSPHQCPLFLICTDSLCSEPREENRGQASLPDICILMPGRVSVDTDQASHSP